MKLSTDHQRSVRSNKKKKSTHIFPYPDEAIKRLARSFIHIMRLPPVQFKSH